MIELTEQEIEKCKSYFREALGEFDRDTITYLELKEILEKMGVHFNHMNYFYKALSELDINYTQNISYSEFLQLYQKQVNKTEGN